MKVLNPIQFIFATIKERYELISHIGLFDTGNSSYFSFLNQPFKPEIITKLFENFELKCELQYILTKPRWYFNFNRKGKLEYYIPHTYNNYVIPVPKTISGFQAICEQAEIELIYRKDCAK